MHRLNLVNTVKPRTRIAPKRSPGSKLEQECFMNPGRNRRVIQPGIRMIPHPGEKPAVRDATAEERMNLPGIHIDYQGDTSKWPYAEYIDGERREPAFEHREELAYFAWNRLVHRGLHEGVSEDRLQLAISMTDQPDLVIPAAIPEGHVRFYWRGRILPESGTLPEKVDVGWTDGATLQSILMPRITSHPEDTKTQAPTLELVGESS